MRNVLMILVLCLMASPLAAQNLLKAEVAILNENTAGDRYEFDLYLNQAVDSDGLIFLANSDFVLDFDQSLFVNPQLTKVEDPNLAAASQYGYCSFLPISNGGFNDVLLRKLYYDNTSTTILDGKLIINLSQTAVDPATFNLTTARIDAQSQSHCLGRFSISGYQGGSVNLTWVFDEIRKTRVFGLDQADMKSNPVEVNPVASTTAIDDVVQDGGYKIFPVPAETTLTIEVVDEVSYSHPYEITDVSGRLIAKGEIAIGQTEEVMDVNDLPQGVYFVRMMPNDLPMTTLRWVKE